MPFTNFDQLSAIEDTVFLLLDSDMTEDLSQEMDDPTPADLGCYETSSSRAAITGAAGRELYVRVSVDETDAACIFLSHGDPAASTSNTFMIQTVTGATTDITFTQGSTTIYSIDTAGLPAGVNDLSLHWSTRSNPDTTGAGDAMISEIIIYDHTAGGYFVYPTQVTHAISTTNTAWALSVGGRWNGANLVSDSRQVSKCRIGTTFHTNVEFAENWVTTRTAPSTDTNQIDQLVQIKKASGLGDSGEIVGQANLGYIAEHNSRMRRALWGAAVNVHWSDSQPFNASTADPPVPWVAFAPNTTTYRMRVDMARWVPVPPGCTHVWVRMHVTSYVTAGAAVPVRFRMYAMNRPPKFNLVKYPDAPAFEYAYVQSSKLEVDDGSSAADGRFLSLGWLKLPIYQSATPGFTGTVFLCPAYAVDPDAESANDDNARIMINAVHCRWGIGPGELGLGGG